MVQYGRPSRSSWKESVWSPFGRTIMGKAIWKSSTGTRLGEGFSWMWLSCETSTHYAWRLKITWGADASSRRLQPETHTRWRFDGSRRKESVRSSSGRSIVGTTIWESSIEMRWGESFKLEIFFVNREKGRFLSVYVDDIKLAGKTENMKPTWKIRMKGVDLEEPIWFLDHVYSGCTQRECTISNDIVTNYRICSNPGFLLEPRKNYLQGLQGNLMQKSHLLGPTTWKVMQRNVWKDVANLRIKRLNNYTKSRRHAWTIINLKKKKKKWISWRIIYSLLTKCSQMYVSASYGETRYFMVCEWTCSCGHKMDKSLRQTLDAFDPVHSSHKWVSAILLCGKHCTTMQAWIVSRLWFCKRSRRLKINIRRN